MSGALDDWCSCRWVEADDFDGPEDHAAAVERCWVHGTESADVECQPSVDAEINGAGDPV